jgi:uncharacterized cupredoxin-like copper-binding protein
MNARLIRTFAAISIAALALAACTGTSATPSPSAPTATATPGQTSAAGGTAVQVTLQEWSVLPAPASVAAGDVTFTVTNTGPDDIHEFVVLKTDLDAGALPTDQTGAVTEDAAGIEVVDEIEDIPVGQTQDLTVPLVAGKYVLLCNIYDATEQEAHYQMGMRIPFTVN